MHLIKKVQVVGNVAFHLCNVCVDGSCCRNDLLHSVVEGGINLGEDTTKQHNGSKYKPQHTHQRGYPIGYLSGITTTYVARDADGD